MIAGWYTYRFEGRSVGSNAQAYKLVGVGVVYLSTDVSKIKGRHQASLMRLEGSEPKFKSELFKVTGEAFRSPDDLYDGDKTDLGSLTLAFKSDTQRTRDTFALVRADSDDRFWFISTAPQLFDTEAAEWAETADLVSGEAIRAPSQ